LFLFRQAAAIFLSPSGRILKASMGEADDGVFALDVVVEEVEWLTGNMCFEPKRYFAQFHRQKLRSTP
jgi:hypothetical protein